MIPFPYNQKLVMHVLGRHSRVNVTGLLRRLQVKIENIYLFKILIKKHENVFKSWICPNFLLLPKKSELPKVWGGCSPPRPPGPYAYGQKQCLRITKKLG